jgi:hypothetical protein
MDQTFVTDGVEIRPAVLRSQEIAYIQTEVSVDHEILRRTAVTNCLPAFAGPEDLSVWWTNNAPALRNGGQAHRHPPMASYGGRTSRRRKAMFRGPPERSPV